MKRFFLVPLLFITTLIQAQNIGINNTTPKQVLDVNGKIQIANDTSVATPGAVRYNNTTKDFEGFDGTTWNSFTARASSALPTNPVPVSGYTFASIGVKKSLNFRLPSTNTIFTVVPADKYLIVTSFWVVSNNLGSTGRMVVVLGSGNTLNDYPNGGDNFLLVHDRLSPAFYQSGGGAPLFIVRSGNYFNVSNDPSSDFTVDIRVQGFLVDNLTY